MTAERPASTPDQYIEELRPSYDPTVIQTIKEVDTTIRSIQDVKHAANSGNKGMVKEVIGDNNLKDWVRQQQERKGRLIAELFFLQEREQGHFISGLVNTSSEEDVHPHSINWTSIFIARHGKHPIREKVALDKIRLPYLVTDSQEAAGFMAGTLPIEDPEQLRTRTMKEMLAVEKSKANLPNEDDSSRIPRSEAAIARRLLTLRRDKATPQEWAIWAGIVQTAPYSNVWKAEAGIEDFPQLEILPQFQLRVALTSGQHINSVVIPLSEEEVSSKEFFERTVGHFDFYEPPHSVSIPDQIIQTTQEIDAQIAAIQGDRVQLTRRQREKIARLEKKKHKVISYALTYQDQIRRPEWIRSDASTGPHFIAVLNDTDAQGDVELGLKSPTTNEVYRTKTSDIFPDATSK